MNDSVTKKVKWFLILFLIGIVLVNFYSWLFETRFEGDIASRMLLALGPQFGLGNPYKDLWEIIPPGYIMIFQVWSVLFGSNILFFKFLHLLVISLCAIFLFLILQKYFRPLIFFIVLIFSSVVLYSPAIQSLYLSSEIFGVLFSLAALYCLLYLKNSFWKVGFATTLFFIAGQMKDPFLFGIAAVAPIFGWEFFTHSSLKFKIKLFLSGVLGGVIPAVGFFVYLFSMGSVRS